MEGTLEVLGKFRSSCFPGELWETSIVLNREFLCPTSAQEQMVLTLCLPQVHPAVLRGTGQMERTLQTATYAHHTWRHGPPCLSLSLMYSGSFGRQ